MILKWYQDQSQKLQMVILMVMGTEVETQGDVGVQVGSSSVSTDDMERIQDGSKVQVLNSRIHIMRRGCVTQRGRGSGW